MLTIQTASAVFARKHSTNLAIAALCLAISACSGGADAYRGSGGQSAASAAPAIAAQPAADQVAAPERRELLAPAPTPAPPSLSAMLQLREEIARLEQQGVLPALDRGTDIRGPDANDNGVRDDIEAYIAALPITEPQKKAAMQTARVQQRSLLMDLSDKAAVRALSDASMAATACIGDRFEPDPNPSYEISLKIEAITANTPKRAKRYMRYMAALSGTSTAYPEGDTCEE
jgi:hypothetical protein